ncbi:MAG: RNA methyltransferase [Gammaproteobacteria bacterium]|nr:RNA methyltransferase [Gammaproteobacteria bacterium]
MQAFRTIRIVLVETSHPGNIGAAARAMKTMGLARLYLVRPKYFPDARAVARATGAEGTLNSAIVCDSLDEALRDTIFTIGTSARPRSLPWPGLDARAAADRLMVESGTGECALVFGRERSGLTNEELARCHYAATIPCNARFGSLNLAAAVQVFCYELLMRVQISPATEATQSEDMPAPAQELEAFYAHLEATLIALNFLNPTRPRHLMHRLRRLFNRARPTRNEVNILRGILTATGARPPA